MQSIGRIIILGGLVLVAVGVIIYFFGNRFNWFGNLPGDIKVERENFKFFAPITSMILISVGLSFALWLFRKLF